MNFEINWVRLIIGVVFSQCCWIGRFKLLPTGWIIISNDMEVLISYLVLFLGILIVALSIERVKK